MENVRKGEVMKVNKKTLAMTMMLTLCIMMLSACGKKGDKDTDSTPTVTPEPTVEATVTPEPTVAPTEVPATPTPVAVVDPKATIDGTTYQSEGYGFSITMPEKWVVLGQKETYDYLNTSMGNAYESGDILKTTMEAQGISYLFLATNSEIQANGSVDNFIVQTMPSSMLGGLNLEAMVGTFGTTAKSQYTAMGATCTISEPVKTTKDGVDYFTFLVEANIPTSTDAAKPTSVDVFQSMMYFEKDGTIMQLAGTAISKENLKMIDQIFESIAFE